MTRCIESSQVEIPMFSRSRYRVEREPVEVRDSSDRPIAVDRHIAPAVYSGDEPALLIGSGWGEGRQLLQWVAGELAQSGRAVYTFDHRRELGAYSDPEGHKASTLGAVCRAVSEQEAAFTILAHSEGCIGSVMQTGQMIDEGRAGNITGLMLVDPVGLTESAGSGGLDRLIRPGKLFLRGCAEVVQHAPGVSMCRSLGARGLISVAMYSVPHVPLGILELSRISQTDITDEIRRISHSGIPVGIVGSTKDKIAPVADLKVKAADLAEDGVVYDEVEATHMEFLTQPSVVSAMLRHATTLESRQIYAAENNSTLLQRSIV